MVKNKDRYKRKRPVQQIRDKVLIMCSGETEEIYFNHYKGKHKKELQNISIKVAAHKKSNPLAVVKAALAQRAEYNEVWAVFDRDDFSDFDDAIILASKKEINCAFSNEAIEYWFFLHFDNKTGAMSRSTLSSELERKLGFDYNKGAETIQRACDRISGRLAVAEERARVGHQIHEINSGHKPSGWCSCTTIYALTKRMREWSIAKSSRKNK